MARQGAKEPEPFPLAPGLKPQQGQLAKRRPALAPARLRMESLAAVQRERLGVRRPEAKAGRFLPQAKERR